MIHFAKNFYGFITNTYLSEIRHIDRFVLLTGTGTGSSSEFVMSVYDRSPTIAISPDGLRCQSRHMKEWHGCRAAKGIIGKGKIYYEATVEDEGLCRVGFSTSEVNINE